MMASLITLCASCSAVYCNRSCPWPGLWVCLWVCYHDNIKIACIDPHQTGSVGRGSDHSQLIKFWPSRAPGNGVCGRANFFGSTLLQPACSVCVSLSAFLHNVSMLWGQGHNDVVDTRHFFPQSSRNYHDFPLTFPDTLAFPDFPRSGNPGKKTKRDTIGTSCYTMLHSTGMSKKHTCKQQS